MKTKRFCILHSAFCILLALLLPGCATAPTPETIASFVADARDIATLGTQAALMENPELRPDILLVRDSIAAIEALPDGQVSVDALVLALSRLPVPQLQSEKGKIYVTGGRILVRRFVSWISKPEIDIGATGYVRQFATALRQGIDEGLK